MQLTGHKTRAVFERYIVSTGDPRDAARRLGTYSSAAAVSFPCAFAAILIIEGHAIEIDTSLYLRYLIRGSGPVGGRDPEYRGIGHWNLRSILPHRATESVRCTVGSGILTEIAPTQRHALSKTHDEKPRRGFT
jgi:hypothetical protein